MSGDQGQTDAECPFQYALTKLAGPRDAADLRRLVALPALPLSPPGAPLTRAELAHLLNLLLFADLLQRVPQARLYAEDEACRGRPLFLDHGAVRSVVEVEQGALPPGRAAFARLLEPLGFRQVAVYPLQRIRMTGYAYCHADYPEQLAQFFVSELHAAQFSEDFRAAATAVLGSSIDPLDGESLALLEQLARDAALPLAEALALLPALARCFRRHHAPPRLADYERLRAESAEMAWIATEGSAYNHVTDRVDDVQALSERQRALGRPIKDSVEISRDGSVRQTAFRAGSVTRLFRGDGGPQLLQVPGSFIEFISRDRLPADGALDLRFDAANAQGIFKMTAG